MLNMKTLVNGTSNNNNDNDNNTSTSATMNKNVLLLRAKKYTWFQWCPKLLENKCNTLSKRGRAFKISVKFNYQRAKYIFRSTLGKAEVSSSKQKCGSGQSALQGSNLLESNQLFAQMSFHYTAVNKAEHLTTEKEHFGFIWKFYVKIKQQQKNKWQDGHEDVLTCTKCATYCH